MFKNNREMSGIYLRVFRDGKWQSLSISDLTSEEIDKQLYDKDKDFLIRTIKQLIIELNSCGATIEWLQEKCVK